MSPRFFNTPAFLSVKKSCLTISCVRCTPGDRGVTPRAGGLLTCCLKKASAEPSPLHNRYVGKAPAGMSCKVSLWMRQSLSLGNASAVGSQFPSCSASSICTWISFGHPSHRCLRASLSAGEQSPCWSELRTSADSSAVSFTFADVPNAVIAFASCCELDEAPGEASSSGWIVKFTSPANRNESGVHFGTAASPRAVALSIAAPSCASLLFDKLPSK
mmetsp:Transcript_49036/g.116678  ORF Transcript_49036/g.116678 Transcript_49036/m.116678 type:complete len:217 (-) Transcript_49036:136-786(-)